MSLDPDQWMTAKEILVQALDQPIEGRRAYIHERCKGDAEIEREVLSLLDQQDKTGAVDHPIDFIPSEPENPHLPDRIGDFEVIERIGQGGMGVVYQARDTTLNRFVALKVPHAHFTTDPKATARFVREAKAASSLDHPNICTILEIGEVHAGGVYIAMPFYEGETLDEMISRGPIELPRAIDVAHQTADGLVRAHEAGIIHRDIKPANILVTTAGRVKILDFGIAKMTGVATTMTVGTLGTLAYMSPEQLEGRVPDVRTDVWSLGVVIFEMLTGSRPFSGEGHPAVIHSILTHDPLTAAAQALPSGIDQIIRKALEKDPSNRYAFIGDLLLDLENLERGRPELIRPLRRSTPSRRRRLISAVSVIILTVVLGGLLLLEREGNSLQDPGRSEDGLITDYGGVAVFPFASPEGSYSERGLQTARHLSQLLNDAGVLTSIDFNAIVSRIGNNESVDLAGSRAISADVGASFFVVGHEVSEPAGIMYAASLYDRNASLVSRYTSTLVDEDDVAGAADQFLFELLQQWELRPYKRLAWSRHLIPSAVRSTSSGAALKEFVLAALRPNQGHLRRATEIDSTFAQAWWIRDIHGYDGSNEETRRQLLRYEHKLPPIERGLMDIYLRRRPEVSVRRQFQALVNEYRDDGPLWCVFAEYQSIVNPRFGRRLVDARPAFERCESLTGDPHFRLAQIKLMDGDPSGHLETLEWEMTRGDSTGRWAWEYEHAMIHAGFVGRMDKIDSLFAIRERFHPFRVLVPAMHLMQHGRRLDPARYIVDKMIYAEELTEDWYPFALALDAAIDMAAGNVKRGTEKWLAVADDSPEYLPGLVVQRFLDPMPESRDFWSDIVNRVERWDTLSARGLIGSIDIHSGLYDEVQTFLAGLAGSALDDDVYLRSKMMRLEAIGTRKGTSSIAAMLERTLLSIAAVKSGDVEAAMRLIEKSRELYRPPPDSYHSPLAEQLIDRYLYADMLFGNGRYEDAEPWFLAVNDTAHPSFFGVWAIGPVYLKTGQIYEELGRVEEAAEAYDKLISFWLDPDPELFWMVEEAQTRKEMLLAGVASKS